MRKWTEDEEIYLEYFVYSCDSDIKEAEIFLNRSKKSVSEKLKRMRKKDRNIGLLREKWTEREENFLIRNYLILTNKQLSEAINKTENAIANKKSRLNLRKEKHVKKHHNEIIELAKKGYRRRDIASELGIVYGSLNKYLIENKIHCERVPVEEMTKAMNARISRDVMLQKGGC